MIEDKLEHDERLRLEALAQSLMFGKHFHTSESPEQIVQRAKTFEAFVKGDS